MTWTLFFQLFLLLVLIIFGGSFWSHCWHQDRADAELTIRRGGR